jgi:hypothetical protein
MGNEGSDSQTDGIEIDGIAADMKAVCEGAQVTIKPTGENGVAVDVHSDDGLSKSRIILSSEQAEAFARELLAHVDDEEV